MMKTTDNKPFYALDPWLAPFEVKINGRYTKMINKEKELTGNQTIADFALGHLYYGLHETADGWIFREWAPHASDIYIVGSFNGWEEQQQYRMQRINVNGDWEIRLSADKLKHGDLYKLSVHWEGGRGERLPSYVNRVVQDDLTKIFSAQVWCPEKAYQWKEKDFVPSFTHPVIYEAHIGMATESYKTGTYREFMENVIPRIAADGYNTIQLMAVQEHPFYGSFGYHVTNFFAASSRFGTPEDLKELIDTAHGCGMMVIMDLIHSHSAKNINEGLGNFDGDFGEYFHLGPRRVHIAWNSLCFDYGRNNVLHFLLSNCRYWLDEYQFDGFRFDGVTSMIYYDHGLERNFTKYDEYYDGGQDEDALTYLFLANKLIHAVKPHAITIAEEMSGYPGLAAPVSEEGIGFDYRLSMGVPDFWIKLTKEVKDEDWNMGQLMYELTTHRVEEKIISYCESHDQALVGDKTLIFRMIDAEMYMGMSVKNHSFVIDRGIALHKMIRLITFAASGGGYLNFMGNEFGHPEWIDFPREGNGWSYKYARRQWSLADNADLKYLQLGNFDKKMISLQKDHKLLDDPIVYRIYENEGDKIIAFTRGDLLFVFNFHPSKSFADYGIPVEGKFKELFDTDEECFGGFGRYDKNTIYLSQRKSSGRVTVSTPLHLYLYLPARTAIVLKREHIRNALEI